MPSRWNVGRGLGGRGPRSLLACLQVKTEISVESRHQTLQGLAFPLQSEAQRALQQLRQKTINYIQLVGACSPPWATQGAHTPRLPLRPPVCLWARTVPRPLPVVLWAQSPCAVVYSGPLLHSGTPDAVRHSVRHVLPTHPWVQTPSALSPFPSWDPPAAPITPSPGRVPCPRGPRCPFQAEWLLPSRRAPLIPRGWAAHSWHLPEAETRLLLPAPLS